MTITIRIHVPPDLKCNRCGMPIEPGKDESCWWCIEALCYSCWDEFGHCGHTEADEWNERARRVPQPEYPEPTPCP